MKFLITIPSPFSSKKTLSFDGKKTSGLLFGYFERFSDQSEPSLTIREIYETFKRDGSLEQKIDVLNENIAIIKKGVKTMRPSTNRKLPKAKKTHLQDETKNLLIIQIRRIKKILDEELFSETRSLILSGFFSPKPDEVEGLFSGSENAFMLVKNPPYFRRAGWDLQTLDNPKIIDGKYLEARNGDRKILRVYRDGMVIFAGLADTSFLAFGLDKDEQRGYKAVRALAVVELIANFSQFLEVLRVFLKPEVQKVFTTITFSNPKKEKIHLIKGLLGSISMDWQEYSKSSQLSQNKVEQKIEKDGLDWKKLANKLYQEFAYMFGKTDKDLWFIKDGKIDFETFKK